MGRRGDLGCDGGGLGGFELSPSFAFVGYHPELLEMTVQGFRLFALGYLFCGINIYASSFFTALCNGVVSALSPSCALCCSGAGWCC